MKSESTMKELEMKVIESESQLQESYKQLAETFSSVEQIRKFFGISKEESLRDQYDAPLNPPNSI